MHYGDAALRQAQAQQLAQRGVVAGGECRDHDVVVLVKVVEEALKLPAAGGQQRCNRRDGGGQGVCVCGEGREERGSGWVEVLLLLQRSVGHARLVRSSVPRRRSRQLRAAGAPLLQEGARPTGPGSFRLVVDSPLIEYIQILVTEE